jgi:putative ABC transport system permease protein
VNPPRFLSWLLAKSLDPVERAYVVGDCEEEFRALLATHGRTRANRWFRAQVIRSLASNLARRTRHRRSVRGTSELRTEGDGLMTTLWSDLAYGLRQLRRSPEFSIPALLTLALGIGVAAAVFTVVQRVVLRPLPYPESHRLVRLWDRNDAIGLPRFSVSDGNYFAWQQQNQTLSALGAYREDAFTLATTAGAERVEGARVTASLLDVLGIRPALGRSFEAADDRPGAPAVAIVSHSLAARLGAPHAAVGSSVILEARPHTVIGVLPPTFVFPQQDGVEVLIPYALNPNAPNRGSHFLRVLGRLTPATDLERARADLAVIAGRLGTDHPFTNRGWTIDIDTLHAATVGSVEQPLMILLGAAGLLVIITSANVAGLLLARISSRESEFAVRAALGAGMGRLARQLMTESALLSLVGGAIGVLLGRWALTLLLTVNPDALPRPTEIGMDVRVLATMLGVSLLTGLTFSLVPLLTRMIRPGHSSPFTAAGRGVRGGAQPVRRLLVAGQIALALSLAVGASLLVRNLIQLQHINPGFSTSGVLTLELNPPQGRYGEPPTRVRMYRELLAKLEALPGAEAVGAAHRLPLSGNSSHRLILEEKRHEADKAPSVNYRALAGDYFEALGIRLERGRFFTDAEMWDSGGAVIVNRALVEQHLPSGDPLLRRIVGPRDELVQIVGVVDDVREARLDGPVQPALYFPYATYPAPAMTLLVRNSTNASALAPPALQAIREIDSLLAPGPVRTVDQFLRTVTATPRFNTLLLASFAAIALVLAAVGIYGVTAYAVCQRTGEIGVRMALGADTHDIFRSVLAPGMRLAAVGTILGLVFAALIARVLGGVVLGVSANQPMVYVTTALALLAVATVATIVPARRAMRLDPVAALRQD